jgi:hypothetical protein
MMQMSSQDREVYLAEEAKRAKRNHKIFLLSKNNGLMTPQDKNFITRIQLQQLLTATGGIDNEPGSEDQLAEDFYYQVYAQIRGPPRSGPGQPLNQFAQTYLFQTGSRYGYGRSRHHPRGGDNHVQRSLTAKRHVLCLTSSAWKTMRSRASRSQLLTAKLRSGASRKFTALLCRPRIMKGGCLPRRTRRALQR